MKLHELFRNTSYHDVIKTVLGICRLSKQEQSALSELYTTLQKISPSQVNSSSKLVIIDDVTSVFQVAYLWDGSELSFPLLSNQYLLNLEVDVASKSVPDSSEALVLSIVLLSLLSFQFGQVPERFIEEHLKQ